MNVTLAPCGTRAAYVRHLRHRETPCEECYRAMRVYEARRRGTPEPTTTERLIRELVHVLACELGVGRQL